jgi:hypothetical protein
MHSYRRPSAELKYIHVKSRKVLHEVECTIRCGPLIGIVK